MARTVGEACRSQSVNGGWCMVNHDVYFWSGKGVTVRSQIVVLDSSLSTMVYVYGHKPSVCKLN